VIWTYITPILRRTTESVPSAIVDAWAANALAHIDDKMIPGYAALLASNDTFQTRLVTPAQAGYPGFLNPGRTSRRGIPTDLSTQFHVRHLQRSYDKIKASVDFLLGDGLDDYKARLLVGKDAYREGESLPLSLTGDFLELLYGAAVRQWLFLSLADRFPTYKWLVDVQTGTYPPADIFLAHGHGFERARTFVNLLIQGGCFFLERQSLGEAHTRLDTFLMGNLAAAYLPPPDSTVRLLSFDGNLAIRTVISDVEGGGGGEGGFDIDVSGDIYQLSEGGITDFHFTVLANVHDGPHNPFSEPALDFYAQVTAFTYADPYTFVSAIYRPHTVGADVIVIYPPLDHYETVHLNYLGTTWSLEIEGEINIVTEATLVISGTYVMQIGPLSTGELTWRVQLRTHLFVP
jgi:hypothetical protein